MTSREIGVVTRADTGQATGSLALAEQSGLRLAHALQDLPPAVQAAARDLKAMSRLHQRDGYVHGSMGRLLGRHQEAIGEQIKAIRAEQAALSANARAIAPFDGATDLTQRDDLYQRIYRLRTQGDVLERTLDASTHIHTARFAFKPAARRLFFGPTGTLDGWAAGAARYPLDRARMVARTGQALSIAWFLNVGRRSMSKAERYEEDIMRLGARLDTLGESGEGAQDIRDAMTRFARELAMVGSDALSIMNAMGPYSSPEAALRAARWKHRYGVSLGATGRSMRSLMDFTADGRPLKAVAGLEGMMLAGGMQNRPEEFLADVMDIARPMAKGQGAIDLRDAAWMAAAFASAGLGGKAWRGLARGVIEGTRAMSSPTMLAAKIAAVRKGGALTIGQGRFMSNLDPNTLRGPRRLIDSGDRLVTTRFFDYADRRAKGDPEMARDIFQALNGGHLSTRDVDVLYGARYKLKRPDFSDNWHKGPMFTGPDGTEHTSIAGMRAREDVLEHRLGRQLVGLAAEMKDALAAGAHSLQEVGNIESAYDAMVSRLSPTSRAIIGAAALAKGGVAGTATAALMAKPEIGQAMDAAGQAIDAMTRALPFGGLGGAGLQGMLDATLVFDRSPVEGGRVTSDYGHRVNPHTGAAHSHHHGIDFGGLPIGTPVHAVGAGTVETARFSKSGGNMVVIRHPNGLRTAYMHLDSLGVEPGQRLQSGVQVGTLGTTGKSTGPHLHFEVRRGRQRIDPRPYLRRQQ